MLGPLPIDATIERLGEILEHHGYAFIVVLPLNLVIYMHAQFGCE